MRRGRRDNLIALRADNGFGIAILLPDHDDDESRKNSIHHPVGRRDWGRYLAVPTKQVNGEIPPSERDIATGDSDRKKHSTQS